MRHHLAGWLVALTLLASPALADTLRIAGAGSLTDAFTDLLRRFPAGADTISAPEFGPSGLMREKIETGLDYETSSESTSIEAPKPCPRRKRGRVPP